MDDFAPDNLLAPDDTHTHPLKAFFLELGKVLLFGACAVVLIRYFIFKPFIVKGASMEPNFHEREYLIIDEVTYRLSEPKRGDIVVLANQGFEDHDYYIKRVIGLPGDRVVIANGRVKIYNTEHPGGTILDEREYLSSSVITTGDTDVTLDQNHYFVLGDNRSASLDSRRIGPVKKSDIVGRALFRGWPIDRIEFLAKTYLPE